MANFNDAKKEYYYTQQTKYTSKVGVDTLTLEAQALAEALSISTPLNIVDTWRAYFISKGYTAANQKNLTDTWYEFLGDNGFTQKSLRGRLKAFYVDGSVNL